MFDISEEDRPKFSMESSPEYSVQNGMRFHWSSMTGDLNPERVQLLERWLCGKEILDAGCGGGAFTEFIAGHGYHVTGVDYHEMFLDVARKRPGSSATYIQGDIMALPFPDKSFDCTCCFDVLEHVDDVKALAELTRVTRTRIIFAVPATDMDVITGGLTFQHYRDLTHLRTYTAESLGALIEANGQKHFEIVPELAVGLPLVAGGHFQSARTTNPVKALARNSYHALLRFLLRYARFETIYSGWAAVIDLEDTPSRARP